MHIVLVVPFAVVVIVVSFSMDKFMWKHWNEQDLFDRFKL